VRYLSICSGIEAASVALEPLGWRAVGFAEIEKFPSEVLAHRFGSNMPGEALSSNGIPNHGDFTQIDLATVPPVEVLIGGTPCQAFSIAGKRLSLADARGNLTLAFVVLAHELARSHGLKIAWWENVPGVLSTDDNAFGCFLGGLVGADDALLPCVSPNNGKRGNQFWRWSDEAGKLVPRWPSFGMASGPRARVAWRVLDAQWFGVAQRRERVFVVASFGEADPAEILFERKGMRGDSPPSREEGQNIAGTLSARTQGGGGLGTDFELDGGLICAAHGQGGAEILEDQCPTLTCNHEAPIVAHQLVCCEIADTLSVGANQTTGFFGDVSHTLTAEGFDASEDGSGRGCPVVAFSSKDHGADATQEMSPTLRSMGHDASHANGGGQVAVAYRTSGNCGAWETGDKTDALTTGTDQSAHIVAIAIQAGALRENPLSGPDGVGVQSGLAYTLEARTEVQAVAYDPRGREGGAQFEGPHDTANIRAASGGSPRSYVQQDFAVRRLTPTECERLQGFPDGWTAIPRGNKSADECPDGPRYKALGNSMAVNVMRWIGKRIAMVDEMTRPK